MRHVNPENEQNTGTKAMISMGGGINKTTMLLEKVIPYIKAMLVRRQQKQNQVYHCD